MGVCTYISTTEIKTSTPIGGSLLWEKGITYPINWRRQQLAMLSKAFISPEVRQQFDVLELYDLDLGTLLITFNFFRVHGNLEGVLHKLDPADHISEFPPPPPIFGS